VPADAVHFDGHWYKLYTDALGDAEGAYQWDQGKGRCETMGGHLITVGSEDENSLALQLMRKAGENGTYLGLRLLNSEWRWITGERLGYTNWAPDHRHQTGRWAFIGRFYIFEDGSSGWVKHFDSGHHNYICEWE